MTDSRRKFSWLPLSLVVVVAGGAAALGIAEAPQQAGFQTAVSNTLAASNYTEVLTQVTPQGSQVEHLVFQSSGRLGGYVEVGSQRSYVVVLGSTEYQSAAVASSASTTHLTFFRQPGQPAIQLDPVHGYLPYAKRAAHVRRSGPDYSFNVTKSGQTALFRYTVSGQYISNFTLTVQGGEAKLAISEVDASPSVQLPAGAKIVTTPAG